MIKLDNDNNNYVAQWTISLEKGDFSSLPENIEKDITKRPTCKKRTDLNATNQSFTQACLSYFYMNVHFVCYKFNTIFVEDI